MKKKLNKNLNKPKKIKIKNFKIFSFWKQNFLIPEA
jgi:hypothetical protein